MKTLKVDKLTVEIYKNRDLMGVSAAKDISEKMAELIEQKGEINVVFAAAPSQNDVLRALVSDGSIKWQNVNAFHMDEYIGLSETAPQGFGNFLKDRLFGLVPFKSVNYINVSAQDAESEAKRYGELLDKYRTDIVVMGIGENGHIAFNDPPVADFNDAQVVKKVELDEICRNQQVNDGCFKTIDEVPKYALTLTIPTLMRAKYHFCIVPAKTKAKAVYDTLYSKIGEHCPATVLRNKENAKLYLDADSSALIK